MPAPSRRSPQRAPTTGVGQPVGGWPISTQPSRQQRPGQFERHRGDWAVPSTWRLPEHGAAHTHSAGPSAIWMCGWNSGHDAGHAALGMDLHDGRDFLALAPGINPVLACWTAPRWSSARQRACWWRSRRSTATKSAARPKEGQAARTRRRRPTCASTFWTSTASFIAGCNPARVAPQAAARRPLPRAAPCLPTARRRHATRPT